jgi:hypothetical protein
LFLSIYANNITSKISNAAVAPPPPEAVESIVTCPVDPETVILVPATIEVTIPVNAVPEPVNEVAVTIPVKFPSPTIDSFDVGFVVPMPTEPSALTTKGVASGFVSSSTTRALPVPS